MSEMDKLLKLFVTPDLRTFTGMEISRVTSSVQLFLPLFEAGEEKHVQYTFTYLRTQHTFMQKVDVSIIAYANKSCHTNRFYTMRIAKMAIPRWQRDLTTFSISICKCLKDPTHSYYQKEHSYFYSYSSKCKFKINTKFD